MDMSFMSKFLVQGADAGRLLDRISANDVDGAAGRITYTQWLNEAGTLEADLTVTKLDDDDFLVVASDTAHRHVETLDAAAHRRAARVRHRRDVAATRRSTCRVRARASCCRSITTRDMSNEAFPFRDARARSTSASRACCACASRTSASSATSCTCPPSRPSTSTTASSRPASRVGLRHAGLKALASLRMEKGYRDYGHDIDNTDDRARGRARLRGRARQAGRLPRPRRRRRRARRRAR